MYYTSDRTEMGKIDVHLQDTWSVSLLYKIALEIESRSWKSCLSQVCLRQYSKQLRVKLVICVILCV